MTPSRLTPRAEAGAQLHAVNGHPPAAQPPLTLGVVDRWEDFLAMGEAWNHLVARSPQRDNPFLTHEWFWAWWEAFGEGRELQVLTLSSGGRLVALAPLMRSRVSYHGLRISLLSLITNDHTNRADLILAERPGEATDLVLDFVRRTARRWDMVELDFLPAHGATAATIRARAGAHRLRCGEQPSYWSPYIPLAGDWEAYYATRDGRFRRNLRNREKRLAALGAVEFEEYPDSLNGVLHEMFEVGEKSWKGKEQSAIGSTPALRCFYGRLADLTRPQRALSLHVLRVGGKPIAFHYSLRNEHTVYLLKTEFDTDYHSYSPGHQIQKRVLQGCFARGLREFDFLGPDMAWKREWTDTVRPHVRLLLFHRGLRSRLLAFLEFRAKPILKRSALVCRLWSPANAGTQGKDHDAAD